MSDTIKHVEYRIERKGDSLWWMWSTLYEEQAARSSIELRRTLCKEAEFRLVKRTITEEVIE